MKKCFHCGAPWTGLGGRPRARERCEDCHSFLHCCDNCHHFDHILTNSCKLRHTAFVGDRDSLNYCEEFRMLDSVLRAREDRVSRAKDAWEALFRR